MQDLVDTAMNFQRRSYPGKSYAYRGVPTADGSGEVSTGSIDELDDVGAFQITFSKDRVEISLKVAARSAAGRSPGHAELVSPVAAPSFDIWN